MKQFVTREHEIEPVPGLPGQLPAGEVMLWQGRPSAQLVARHALKNRWIASYFALLAVWTAASGFHDGDPVGGIVFSIAIFALLAAAVIGLIELFAWGVERTTLYTITTERVVMRFGVALSMTLNLPYRQISTVSLARQGAKGGSIAIGLPEGSRLSWAVQWPHVRGWRFSSPEPSLICLADATQAAAVLEAAVSGYRNAHASQIRVVQTQVAQAGTAQPVAIPAE